MLLESGTKFIVVSIQILLVAGSINENIIDTECSVDADCKVFTNLNAVANTTCFNRHCICRDSDFKTIQCLPQKKALSNVIGGNCPCSSIKGSSCVSGFCMCEPGFKSSEDKRSCIPKRAQIGERCEKNVECSEETTFAMCTNHTCSCKPDFILHNGTCQSLVGLGEDCESDNKCLTIPNTLCISKQCLCQPGYVAKFDKTACLPNADYNDGCLESVQCQHRLGEGAVCEQNKCVCGEDFFKGTLNVANETRTLCENRIVIGQACAYDDDCFQSRYNGTEKSMYCSLKECQCAEDYEEDRDQQFCVKSKHVEMENTWFDSIVAKISSTFASSSGNRNNSIDLLMVIVCIVSIVSFV